MIKFKLKELFRKVELKQLQTINAVVSDRHQDQNRLDYKPVFKNLLLPLLRCKYD